MPKHCGAEKRKIRKANRRKKDRSSLKERRMTAKEIDKLAWRMAKIMTQGKVKGVNLKHYCEQCEQFYCQGFDGIQVFCRKCFYKDCCMKFSISHEKCNHCERGW